MITVSPALGRKWASLQDAVEDLALNRSVRCGKRFMNLLELRAEAIQQVEAKHGAHSFGVIVLNDLQSPKAEPLRHKPLHPRISAPIPSESEAREACNRARALRKRIERATISQARLAAHVEALRRSLALAEGIIEHWESSITPVQRIVASSNSTPRTVKPKVDKTRMMENKLRVALGLLPLADDEVGLL